MSSLLCYKCREPMIGIYHPDARVAHTECGGEAIIGNDPAHKQLVQEAFERLSKWDQVRMLKPWTPPRPQGEEAA